MTNKKSFKKLLFKIQNLSNINTEYSPEEIEELEDEVSMMFELDSYLYNIVYESDYTFDDKFLEKFNKLTDDSNFSLNNCVLAANLILKLKLEEQKLS